MAIDKNKLDLYRSIVNIQANDVTRENANMNADTPAGMMMKFASTETKEYTLEDLVSKEYAKAHIEGYIHQHDMDYYPTKSLTCVQHPLDRILAEGFKAGHGSSRPAQSIRTAGMLACISLETAQNEMHGGQGIPAFDFYMAPYVRKTFSKEYLKACEVLGVVAHNPDEVYIPEYVKRPLPDNLIARAEQQAINETIDQTYQSMEAFIHNMNTIHSRGGNQVVFSSINYGTDTSAEGRLVMRALLESTIRGVGNGETPIFPNQIFKMKEGVNLNPGDPNYDIFLLGIKCASKRYFPTFQNLDTIFNFDPLWKANDPKRYMHEVATMGCRTRIYADRHGMNTSVGRGNLSFTSVNLPRMAIEAVREAELKGTDAEKIFFAKLGKYTKLAAEQLKERYDFQKTALKKQMPLVMGELWVGSDKLKPCDPIEEVIKHGSLSVGFVGLAEALKMLLGVHHGESDEAQAFGLRTIKFMRKICDDYSDKYDLNYSLLATPAESLAGRFARIDREKFGVIPGVTDRGYYTNSNHVPVYFKLPIYKKAELEAPYHNLTNAGHIFYTELDGELTNNLEAVEKVVRYLHDSGLGFFALNFKTYRCLDCGHETKDVITECPHCGSDNVDILERITGYLVGNLGKWNAGKKAEHDDRVTHAL